MNLFLLLNPITPRRVITPLRTIIYKGDIPRCPALDIILLVLIFIPIRQQSVIEYVFLKAPISLFDFFLFDLKDP